MGTHLLVLLHGIEGHASAWNYVSHEIGRMMVSENSLGKVAILACRSNQGSHTHDGIEVCGDRAASEVRAYLLAHPDTTHVSILAHSLGGLIARHMICVLHNSEASSVVWRQLVKHRFVSLAVPHLGIVNLPRMWRCEGLAQWIASWVPSRTIRQLMLQDPERLLYRMATEPAYIDAWREFSETHLYANVHHDHLVHHDTASITPWHPSVRFPRGVTGATWRTDPLYPAIYDWASTGIADNTTQPFPTARALQVHPLQEELCDALQSHRLNWVRFDICDRALHSHLDVIVSIPWLHDYGRGIVRHYLENGLLLK